MTLSVPQLRRLQEDLNSNNRARQINARNVLNAQKTPSPKVSITQTSNNAGGTITPQNMNDIIQQHGLQLRETPDFNQSQAEREKILNRFNLGVPIGTMPDLSGGIFTQIGNREPVYTRPTPRDGTMINVSNNDTSITERIIERFNTTTTHIIGGVTAPITDKIEETTEGWGNKLQNAGLLILAGAVAISLFKK